MADIASIGAILSSLKTATEIAQFLRKSDVSLERAELKLKLADLVGALADAKLEMASVEEIVAEKDKRIKELEEAFQRKDDLTRFRDAYYLLNSEGEPCGDPHCVRCWDIDHKQYQLHYDAKDRSVTVCPACESRYEARRANRIADPSKQKDT